MKSIAEIELLIKNNRVDDAEAALNEVLAGHPEDVEARLLLGVCGQMRGDTASFCRIYDELAPELTARAQTGETTAAVARWRHYCKVASYLAVLGLITFVGTTVQVACAAEPPAQQENGTLPATPEQVLAMPEFKPVFDGSTNIVQVKRSDGTLLIVARSDAQLDYDDEDERSEARDEAKTRAERLISELVGSMAEYTTVVVRETVDWKARKRADVAVYVMFDGRAAKVDIDRGFRKKYGLGGRKLDDF